MLTEEQKIWTGWKLIEGSVLGLTEEQPTC